ncbi:MAG: hypothetical protein ACP5TJ_01745 [Candidatus Micrarchaeia archaeon]
MLLAYLAADSLLAVFLLAYYAYASPKKNFLFRLFAAILFGALIALAERSSVTLMLSGIVIFSVFSSKVREASNFLVLPFAIFYIYSVFGLPYLAAQAMLLGLLSSVSTLKKPESSKKEKRQETNRDILQVCVGIVLFAALLALGAKIARPMLLMSVAAAMSLGTFAYLYKGNRFSKAILSLERKKEPFGSGAFWLASGLLLALSFVSNEAYLLAVLSALFFGDSMATIIGINLGKHHLPYSRGKSVEGSLSYFAVVLAVAYPFVGFSAFVFAALGSLFESLPLKIDDNFLVSVVLVAAALALSMV